MTGVVDPSPARVPSFASRVFVMPLLPALQGRARSWRVGQVLLPLFVLMVVVRLLLGLFHAAGVSGDLRRFASTYDDQFDPIVFEGGEVRVVGSRLPKLDEEGVYLLVDPDETVDLADIDAGQAFVVRRDRILVRRPFQPDQEIPLAKLEEIIGKGPTTIDSAWLGEKATTWGPRVALGVFGLSAIAGLLRDLVACPLFALVSGALLFALRSKALSGAFGAAYRVALATSSSTLVASAALSLLRLPRPGCSAIMIWPALMLGLGLLALRGVEAPPLPPPPR